MDVLALVPARGGSLGVPRKNLALVAGRPLLAWTVDAGRRSVWVTRVVVSTDSDEIAGVARELGADALERPPELATNEAPMRGVIDHALGEVERPEILVLLQPTSPLRRAEHVDGAIDLLLRTGADSVVSVVEVPHRFGPDSLLELHDGRVRPLGATRHARRQDKPQLYARNGPAVLALRPDRLGDDLYGGNCRAYVMEQRDSIDIDGPFDLELAELLLARR